MPILRRAQFPETTAQACDKLILAGSLAIPTKADTGARPIDDGHVRLEGKVAEVSILCCAIIRGIHSVIARFGSAFISAPCELAAVISRLRVHIPTITQSVVK